MAIQISEYVLLRLYSILALIPGQRAEGQRLPIHHCSHSYEVRLELVMLFRYSNNTHGNTNIRILRLYSILALIPDQRAEGQRLPIHYCSHSCGVRLESVI